MSPVLPVPPRSVERTRVNRHGRFTKDALQAGASRDRHHLLSPGSGSFGSVSLQRGPEHRTVRAARASNQSVARTRGVGDRRRARPAVLVPPRLPTSSTLAARRGRSPCLRHALRRRPCGCTRSSRCGSNACVPREIYRYEFDAQGFEPWEAANGQWTCDRDVTPRSVTAVGDLLTAHADASIELRIVPSLWPLHDVAVGGEFDFSMVRMHNAQPRQSP